ncbi:phage tail protein [Pseudomonas fulva]|uniref:phage tail protein n=1 Tax=Pseudomonas fulva TaxID=47880 RepID=UPI00201E2D5C|nr:phage tail protein [Pseudomonas fulva]UQY32663.1 phage tail protein [Pseudomonas fulva]
MGNKPQTIGYRYFMGIHMGLCRGPINELREIRVGDRTAWRGSAVGQARWQITASSLFGGDEGEGGIYGTIDMMLGTETQPVNPRLKRMLGSALVPAFRGITTLFFDGLISSMNPYPKSWKVRARRVTSGWDDDIVWYPEKSVIWQGDNTISSMNPAHIIYEAFTNRDWGRGRATARIHEASFRAAADQLFNEGFGLCICWRRQDGLGTLVKSVIDHIGAVLIDDLVTGQVSLRLIRDNYVVADLPMFDEDSGLLGIDDDDAADGSMATNEIVVKFRNMMDSGKDDQVRVQNNAGIQSVGAVLSETVDYPHIPTSGLAGRLAQRDLAAKSAAVRRFKVRLDRRGAGILPGSVFRVRSRKRGYEQLVLRAGQCDYGTLQAGTVTISCVVDAYGLPETAYVAPQPPTIKPPTNEPLPATVRRVFEIPYRDLVRYLDPAQLTLVTEISCGVGVIARRPSAAALGYTLLTRVSNAGFGGVDAGDWCPTAQVVTPLDYLTTSTRLTYGTDISTVQAGDVGMIDDEIVRVVSLDIDTGDLVLARGCSDTVPAKHLIGARIWFYGSDTAVDPADYAPGVTIQAKVQTRTSTGLLDIEQTPTDSYLTVGRQARPFPPGRFMIGGASYPVSTVGSVVSTWTHRDRLAQADQLVDTSVGNIGPETGTTYSARMLRADTGAVLASQAGINGLTATLSSSYEGEVVVELWSVRSGLESFQRHRHQLTLLQPLVAPSNLTATYLEQ